MSGSPGLSGELGNYCICLCVAQSYITGSLESSLVMVVSYGTEAAFNQAILYVLGKVGQGLIPAASTDIHWQPIIFCHCHQKYPSQATWKIFQLTLKGEQSTSVSCIYFGKAETAQPSCHYRMSPTVLHVPVVYLPNIYLCYYLQAQLTCHNKFCKKFFVHVRTLCTRRSLRFFECLGTRLKHWT